MSKSERKVGLIHELNQMLMKPSNDRLGEETTQREDEGNERNRPDTHTRPQAFSAS